MRCSLALRIGSLLAFALLAELVALPTASRGQAAKKGKKYALLVGVNTYEHQKLKALKFTENDVEAMADVLRSKSIGFDSVRLLTSSRGKKDEKDSPTAANIQKEIDKLLDTATGADMILIAFSGHGVQLEVKDPAEKGEPRTYPYFCPSDSD